MLTLGFSILPWACDVSGRIRARAAHAKQASLRNGFMRSSNVQSDWCRRTPILSIAQIGETQLRSEAQRRRERNSDNRHSREGGNPFAFFRGRKMDPRLRGDDATLV